MTAHRKKVDLALGRVDLNHGSGGRATAELIESLFARAFDNPWLAQGHDSTVLELPPGRLVVSTDSFVVSPPFFPGGDIGRLAVHGTVNDLAMSGARPLYLTCAFILEEGFALADLKRVVDSMAEAATAAEVAIVAGDTKVVERGKGDGIFINTTGVGVVPPGVGVPAGSQARPGDAVLVSGPLGDHGVAILSTREGLEFETPVVSDTAALHGLVAAMQAAVPELHVLRDPTRGGLAAALNEIAQQSGVGMLLEEAAIPVRPEVAAACELLGLDPLHVANEGKLVALCAPEHAQRLLEAMRGHPLGRESARIGTVTEDPRLLVRMRTAFGGQRIVDWPSGEQLPRIC